MTMVGHLFAFLAIFSCWVSLVVWPFSCKHSSTYMMHHQWARYIIKLAACDAWNLTKKKTKTGKMRASSFLQMSGVFFFLEVAFLDKFLIKDEWLIVTRFASGEMMMLSNSDTQVRLVRRYSLAVCLDRSAFGNVRAVVRAWERERESLRQFFVREFFQLSFPKAASGFEFDYPARK